MIPLSSNFEVNLERYVEVIVKVGLNLQPGQRLLIGTPSSTSYGVSLELAPLIRLIAKKAYQAGAKLVDVFWDDDQIRLIRYQNAPKDSFAEYPKWRADAGFDIAKNDDAMLIFPIRNPDLLSEQDPNLILTTRKASLENNKPANDLRRKGKVNWSAIAAPLEDWTNKVLPHIPQEERKEKIWEIIFDICRINQKDPISVWKDHINQLITRSSYLNIKKYHALKFKAPKTDLTVGLPQRHIWKSAYFTTQSGINNVVNIPTEEIFTTPHKDKTEGTVTASKPLVTDVLIEGLSLTFSEGKVIKASAKSGEEFLQKLLRTDEGATRLGEVSLVPHSSPISQSGLLFYNILIDENASCHLALGNGLRACLENGTVMSDEEFSKAGGNNCLFHLDFMIGSEDMDVDGVKEDGTLEPIMRKGEWAFDV
ncbi:MAG: aminopeptidase [Promethearchaeota archaeon]